MKHVLLIGCTLLASAALAATPKGDAKAGKTLYQTNCSGCHGAKAEGMVGPKLAGDAAKWKFNLFKRALIKGIDDKGKKLKPPMPQFKFTDKQIANIQAYLKTLK
ncbi:c-type cytochrome [Deinococcus roseus]|uniref:Cytochrome c domain-containing protein n=1 Tax=Deinococcus roseus TaxID=392414 RepID=A0ABQ2CZH9_9DEIO|nr:cytochrome c [Deinococcus roseus]GGJ34674.1 hypothetical protein GCM10008938_21080 [Deinococcus roseus]